jgi:thiol-disulfide isomerase/thioredoxin
MKLRIDKLMLALCATLTFNGFASAFTLNRGQGGKPEPTTQAESTVDSENDLRRAIQESGGSENRIILNLEDYLRRYPKSARRAEIEGEVYKLALKLNDRERSIAYAEKMLTGNGNVIELLTTLVSNLRERRKGDDLDRALKYADRLVKDFEALVTSSAKPARMSSARWQEGRNQGLASVHLVRGRLLIDLGQLDRARSDLRKSYDLAPLAGAALSLSELAERQNHPDEALDYGLRAFAIALATDEEIDIRALRRRLSKLYATGRSNAGEAGLGDRFLKVYDSWMRENDERLANIEEPNINSGITDPLSFRLTKLDGSPLEMSSLRGKIIVINFWATWCGPCRTELPLFEKTIDKYRNDSDVVFLAVTTDEDRKQVPEFIRENKYKLPVAFADGLDAHFDVTGIPTTIILDRKGAVSFKIRGFNPKDDFVAALGDKIEIARRESAR